MRLRLFLVVPTVIALMGFAVVAKAGGPFVVDEVGKTGVAQRWQNDTMTYSIDQGNLSSSNNNTAGVALVQEAIAKWAEVTLENPTLGEAAIDTSVFRASVQAQPSEDITLSNFESYLSDDNSNTYIIFDVDGSITGTPVRDGGLGYDRYAVVGLSQPLESDSSGKRITRGVVILNGCLLEQSCVDADPSLGEGEHNTVLTINQFKAAVAHEMGHLANLDHTQINYDVAKNCSISRSCGYNYGVPTMYPILVSDMQSTLKIDDKITLSWIYPAVDDASQLFNQSYGTITGTINDADGAVLKGVNVIAMRCDTYDAAGDTCYTTADPDPARVDARSMVSGVLYPGYYGDSRYYLHGLLPGHSYKVICESLASQFTGASGFEPVDNPPTGITDCNIASSDGSTAPVRIESGGQVIEMAAMTLDVENPCSEAVCGSTTSSGPSSSKCSLTPTGGVLLSFMAVLAAIGAACRRRTRS